MGRETQSSKLWLQGVSLNRRLSRALEAEIHMAGLRPLSADESEQAHGGPPPVGLRILLVSLGCWLQAGCEVHRNRKAAKTLSSHGSW